tara:strand:- start:1236 stop:1928 length:693 start_codon:yes stop_codon:yes gene_type:complete
MALVDHQKILNDAKESMQKLQEDHHEAQGAKRLRDEDDAADRKVSLKKQRKQEDQCTTCGEEIPDEYLQRLCDTCYCTEHQLWNPLKEEDDDVQTENAPTIEIYVEGGCVQDVKNLPKNWQYVVQNKDIEGEEEEEKAGPHDMIIVVEGGGVQEILNLPDGHDCEVKDLDNKTSPSAEKTKADAAEIKQSDNDDEHEHRKVFDRMLSYLDRGSISMTDFNRYLKSVNYRF